MRLYILCGLPFAGKSSLAAALRQRFGYIIVAIDAINSERGLGINAAAIDARKWDETYQEGYRRLADSLAAGETVIFGAPGYTRSQRDALRCIAAAHGALACMLYLDVPAAICRERWLINWQIGARFDVRDEDFENVASRCESPADDEPVLRYDQSQPLDPWIAWTFG